jgi:tartrate dehydrogenase/decarboxylase/D-malate dehydrogenase
MVFWDDIVREIAEEYPEVEVERLLVDAASMDLIRRPEEFDVLVASNLFGDHPHRHRRNRLREYGTSSIRKHRPLQGTPLKFEPVHGSAPDIAGENAANPLATVLSGAMLFDHLGETAAATALRDAVEAQLADGPRTPDLGGTAETDAVVADLRSHLSVEPSN